MGVLIYCIAHNMIVRITSLSKSSPVYPLDPQFYQNLKIYELITCAVTDLCNI